MGESLVNQLSARMTATATFIVRFWRGWTEAESRWRGRIEHVQSGRRADFLYLGDMLRFLRQMGVTLAQLTADVNDESAPSRVGH